MHNRVVEIADGKMSGDFDRFGIAVYCGADPDVSGADFVIDPKDEKAVQLFKEFCGKLAAHYRTFNV